MYQLGALLSSGLIDRELPFEFGAIYHGTCYCMFIVKESGQVTP